MERFLEGVHILFHCAGELLDESRMNRLHVEGTARLIEAARDRIRCWVQLGSVGVYGPVRNGIVTEADAPQPKGVYERSKAESDLLVETAALEGAFKAVILRPSSVFGPGMPNRSLYQLVAMLNRGWFAFVGSPGAVANYVYVDDVAEALWLCGTSPQAHGIYNLSDDRSMEQFVGGIAAALGRKTPALRVPETPVRAVARLLENIPGFPLSTSRVDALTRRVRYPIDRIRTDLAFEFKVSVEEGLRRLVDDWRMRR